jgi:streptogramin lyase
MFRSAKEKVRMKKRMLSCLVLASLCVLASCGSSLSAPTAEVSTRPPTAPTASATSQIHSIGSMIEFSIPTSGSYPGNITAGPDGNLWFTENGNHKIGRISPTGAFTEFSIPTSQGSPVDITAGPDGNLWFTESSNVSSNRIGRISPTGAFTEFPIPTSGSEPSAITAGPDGNLWFTESYGNKIGRISPTGT